MRVLFADQFSEPGGAQMCLMDLLPGVLERGWKAVVMAPGTGRLREWSRANGVGFETLPLSNYASGRKTLWDMARFSYDRVRTRRAIRLAASGFGCDLLYVNGPRVLPAVTGLGIPALFHAHSVVSGAMARKLALRVLEKEKIPVIAVSRFVAKQFAGRKTEIVYNGVPDCGTHRPDSGKAVRIGILGRLAPEKGHLDFIRAARLAIAANRDLSFDIFGGCLFSDEDYERALKIAAGDLPITFHGWRETSAALAAVDILAVPSGPLEGAGRVVVEAFSAGVPVIAYPAGGIPELIAQGKTGILTEECTPESLARAITTLAARPEQRRTIARNAREEWAQRFTVTAYRRAICDLMERHQASSPSR